MLVISTGGISESVVDEAFVAHYRGQFDVVTAFHVLEHLQQPIHFIQACKALLKSGGVLLIEVPNLDDSLLEECSPYRAFYWQRAHLSYFNPQSLSYALKAAGIESYTMRGVQRYGLRNLLHWLDTGKPQLQGADYEATQPLLKKAEALYKTSREESLTSDTLIVTIEGG